MRGESLMRLRQNMDLFTNGPTPPQLTICVVLCWNLAQVQKNRIYRYSNAG